MNINDIHSQLIDWASAKDGADLVQKIAGVHGHTDYKLIKNVCAVVKSVLQEHHQELRTDDISALRRIKQLVQKIPAKSYYSTFSSILKDLKNTIKQIDNSLEALEVRKATLDKPALIMQKYLRGNSVRKPLLPIYELSQYRAASAQVNKDPSSMPRARAGDTPVYFPPNLGVILKGSGGVLNREVEKVNDLKLLHPRSAYRAAYDRFDHMQNIRKILDVSGASHLIIPKAWIIDNFIVEEKLRIIQSYHGNIDLYMSKPHLFDRAISELVLLASKLTITDLVESNAQRITKIRYDNLPFIFNGNASCHIGLIDLEHFKVGFDPSSLFQIAIIFPLHFELIKSIVMNLELEVDKNRLLDVMEIAKKAGEDFLNAQWKDYRNYADWLSQKGINDGSVSPTFQISPQIKEQLISFIENELKKYETSRDDVPFKHIASDIVTLVLEDFKSAIEKKQIQTFGRLLQDPMEMAKLVDFRSVKLDAGRIFEKARDLLRKWDYKEALAAKKLSSLIAKTLVESGEIYSAHCSVSASYWRICY
jgi:hypothetical protein